MTKQHKYPQRKVLANPSHDQAAEFYAATDADAPLTRSQLAAGSVQHPDTRAWQVWLSTNGLDITCLAAASTETEADALAASLRGFLRTTGIYDEAKCAAFFGQLAASGDRKPQPLPDDIVRQIGRTIQHEVAMREE